jgi:hypothetical protein
MRLPRPVIQRGEQGASTKDGSRPTVDGGESQLSGNQIRECVSAKNWEQRSHQSTGPLER